MNLVIDTNIFISALIKEGVTREIIVNSGHNLLFPEFEFEEIKNHKQEIIKKSGLSEKEFDILLLRLLNYVKIIPANFVATALAFNCSIWSEDNHFKKQNKIRITTTKEMVDYLD